MGNIMKLTLLPQKTVQEVKEVEDRKDLASFLEGFMDGMKVGHFNYSNLLYCVYEEDQAAIIFYAAVTLLEQAYHDHAINELAGGILSTLAAV